MRLVTPRMEREAIKTIVKLTATHDNVALTGGWQVVSCLKIIRAMFLSLILFTMEGGEPGTFAGGYGGGGFSRMADKGMVLVMAGWLAGREQRAFEYERRVFTILLA